jgi:hypothetical protein
MAPTNRLIEARRAELRAEADKQRDTKSPTGGTKRQEAAGKTRDKPKD